MSLGDDRRRKGPNRQSDSVEAGPEIPDRLFFKMGQVAKIVGVEPHVLRFWETQFPMLAPRKLPSGHRQYRRKDVELLLTIKRLLRVDRLTIKGAKRALRRRAEVSEPTEARQQMSLFDSLPAGTVGEVREELRQILRLLDF